MQTSDWLMLCTIVLYMGMMLAIGVAVSKKNKTAGDFFLGGRKLGPLVTAMSAEASDMSGWLLMGLPAVAMMGGLAEASWTAIGLAIGTYLNWLFVAKRLRVYSHRIDAFTIPDFFSRRFGDKSRILTIISALFIVIFFIPYTASGFAACGKLFSSLFGIDYMLAMVVSAAVIVIYCTLGGFLAASTTDFVQSIVMTIALFVVVGFTEGMVNGFDVVFANVQGLDGYLDLFKGHNVAAGTAGSYGALPVVSTLAWGLGYFGMPHILLRFMAIRDENEIALARRIGSTWVVIAMSCAMLIGIVGYAMIQANVIEGYTTGSAAETIIIRISNLLSTYGVIPAFIAGVVLAGILASVMSTASGQLLAAASSVSENFLKGVLGIKMDDKATVRWARVTVLGISVLGFILALDPNSSIFRIVSFAWAGFGAAFGPVMLFALFWRRCNFQGALAGMVVGGGVVFIWKYMVRPMGGVWNMYELLPAFIAASIAIVVVSLMTEAPSKEIEDEFDAVDKAV